MAIHATPQNPQAAGKQTIQASAMPSPTKGMDVRQNLAASDPMTCIYSYNLIPSEYGMTVRKGYREWTTGVDDGAGLGVKTLIPFTGDAEDGTTDRLFAVNNEGIWDVTAENTAPTLKFTFAVQTVDAGHGVYTRYTTDAELDIVFYADSLNGLFTYDPVADTWTQTAGITGVDVLLVNFVMVHKQRIWFGVRGGTIGYYLPVGSLAGEAKPFYFGAKFKHGGALAGLFSWTVDGGSGLDDYLIVVSRGGDVLPYQGDDPEATWQNVGTYFIGELPRGSKVGADIGGDLAILSEFGVTAMTDLLMSADAKQNAKESVTFKVASLIRRDLLENSDKYGWEIRYAPSESQLIINAPERTDGTRIQYLYARSTQGWCYLRGLPMDCLDVWQGGALFGHEDKIYRLDADRDGITPTEDGVDIPFSMMTSYNQLNAPALYKRVELIRPTFIGKVAPPFITKANYDYDVTEPTGVVGFTENFGDTWDAGIWDIAKWSTAGLITEYDVKGATGIGRAVSVSVAGRGLANTVLVSLDVMWRSGGAL